MVNINSMEMWICGESGKVVKELAKARLRSIAIQLSVGELSCRHGCAGLVRSRLLVMYKI